MASNDYQPIAVLSRQPRDHVVGWSRWATCVYKRVEPDLKSGNGLVLVKEIVSGSGHAVARFGLIRARLAGPEILERGSSVQDATGIHLAQDRADFRIGRYSTARTKAEKHERQDDEHQSARG